jgi:hypothetical protein
MESAPSTRTVGRTVVVAGWLFALAAAGRPTWAALLLGLVLVAVWASPYLLATNRRSPSRRVVAPPGVGPGRAARTS